VPALAVLVAVPAFIAAGLEAAPGVQQRQGRAGLGHLLLALVDLAAGVVEPAWPGRAEVSMPMAKNWRQPPSIRGPREAGIRPGASAPRPIAPVTAPWLGIAPRSKPVLYRVYR
jgi:hypothetical protein